MALTSPLFVGLLLLAAFAGPLAAAGERKVVKVADDDSFRRALADARPGWRIVLAPGTYRPGVHAAGLRGAAGSPIVIEGADPKNKPVFEGGRFAFHLGDCAHVTLRNIAVRGQSGYGINIDDGGSFDTPAHHVTLEGLDVSDIGPRGNLDGIKLSGVDDLIVRNCTVEGWGGQAIDMVGCHRALVEDCTFRGKPGFSQVIGVQAKGGSSDVTIRRCVFLDAGERAVNLGGSTDPKVFRPQAARYEAKDVTVEGCRFVGTLSPIAFVGVDGSVVRYNTVYRPDKWVVRILQENTSEGMVPSRNGRFERNLVVFRRERVRSPVNVGPNTEPGSFTFAENFWFCEDGPAQSRPDLPGAERGGVYGTDPKLEIRADGAPGAPSAKAADGYGADAFPAALPRAKRLGR